MTAPGKVDADSIEDTEGSEDEQPLASLLETPDASEHSERPKPWADLMDEAENHLYGTNGYFQDASEAYELFGKAAQLGCAKAYRDLGWCRLNGDGVEIDEDVTLTFFKKAIAGGYYRAYEDMMTLYARNNDEPNFHRAFQKYLAARESANEAGVWFVFPLAIIRYTVLAVKKGWPPELLSSFAVPFDEVSRVLEEHPELVPDASGINLPWIIKKFSCSTG